MKPGSCGPGVLGIYPMIYDEDHRGVYPRQPLVPYGVRLRLADHDAVAAVMAHALTQGLLAAVYQDVYGFAAGVS
jgi:hypothetical protein